MMQTIQPICEYRENPLGIGARQPRFSWQLISDVRADRQTAYRILVASNTSLLDQDIGDKWDTGQVESTDTVNIPFDGRALGSGERCFWKVKSWDKSGDDGTWTDTAVFETGLLAEKDWEGAWIAAPAEASAPLFRKEFCIQGQVERARLYICGLGWHEAYLNGEKVGDHEFDPAPTWYDNIFPFAVASRVLYVTHDITHLLRPGKNVIGALLGHGWYSSDSGNPPGRVPSAERPILLAQINIDMKNGKRVSVATGPDWLTDSGPIIENDMVSGETYDARLEQQGFSLPGFAGVWPNAEEVPPPSGKLESQTVEPERITRRFAAKRKLQSGETSWIFDFGQFMSGWAEIRMEGTAGTRVSMGFSGRVNYETASLDTRNADYDEVQHLGLMLGSGQEDTYIMKGDGVEVWHPRFTVHGFRYVEVTGYPGEPGMDAVVGCAVNTDIQATGVFSCSNELFNRIHHNAWWTFRGSYQGIPQDAADRAERLAWLGDPGFVAEDYMYNFRDILFWTKWLDDIADTQRADGSVSFVAPPNWGESSYRTWPCWECAYTLFVWHCYNFYDDRRVLETHYEGVKRQVEHFRAHAEEFILDDALGDHMEPGTDGSSNPSPVDTPKDLCATAYFYRCAQILSKMAEITERGDDRATYSTLAESIKAAFVERFLSPDTGAVATGSQTSNALALYLDLVPDDSKRRVLDHLVEEIVERRGGHLKTGIIGTDALEQALPECGRSDVMYEIASKKTYPSWGYGVVHGQTTIAEDFGCSHHYSVSMKMHGSIEKFFYKDVAGISPASPGYRTVLVFPKVTTKLSSARASIESLRGTLAVEWHAQENQFWMKLTIPAGVDADVKVPVVGYSNAVITESGEPIWKSETYVHGVPGVSAGKKENEDYIAFAVGSGTYEFSVSEV
jgi:alpha-L-rhamnosidase